MAINHGQESPLEVDTCWHHVTPYLWYGHAKWVLPRVRVCHFSSLMKKEKPSFSFISIVSLDASMNWQKTKEPAWLQFWWSWLLFHQNFFTYINIHVVTSFPSMWFVFLIAKALYNNGGSFASWIIVCNFLNLHFYFCNITTTDSQIFLSPNNNKGSAAFAHSLANHATN